MAAQFDAAQYGFFGGAPASITGAEGVLVELEEGEAGAQLPTRARSVQLNTKNGGNVMT